MDQIRVPEHACASSAPAARELPVPSGLRYRQVPRPDGGRHPRIGTLPPGAQMTDAEQPSIGTIAPDT
jgi:hypothetical protein